jgi:hypothetical protein
VVKDAFTSKSDLYLYNNVVLLFIPKSSMGEMRSYQWAGLGEVTKRVFTQSSKTAGKGTVLTCSVTLSPNLLIKFELPVSTEELFSRWRRYTIGPKWSWLRMHLLPNLTYTFTIM